MVGALCWHCGPALPHRRHSPSLRSWGPWQGWEFLNAWGSTSATPHTSVPQWMRTLGVERAGTVPLSLKLRWPVLHGVPLETPVAAWHIAGALLPGPSTASLPRLSCSGCALPTCGPLLWALQTSFESLRLEAEQQQGAQGAGGV